MYKTELVLNSVSQFHLNEMVERMLNSLLDAA